MATIRALTAAALLVPEGARRQELLRLIDAESSEVDALLALAGPDDTSYGGEAVDVAGLVRSVIEPLVPTTEAALAVSETDVGPAEISRVALRRILRNLVQNAVRAAPDGRVEVRVRPGAQVGARSSGGVTVEVADSGPGFGRGPRGLASQGLSIVTELAAAVGGGVDIGRSELGGASVTVFLPSTQAG
ncbi:sensor histidine kinase [Kribbella sp. DT2]|uniref:sensor histidine kinase n=1 Tax=Kribbella sp. DT2 TaxID=3393427 RepID=UPI003CEA0F30